MDWGLVGPHRLLTSTLQNFQAIDSEMDRFGNDKRGGETQTCTCTRLRETEKLKKLGGELKLKQRWITTC